MSGSGVTYHFYTPTIAPAPTKALYDPHQQQQQPEQLRELVAANVNKLRELRTDLKKEDWLYEAPRHTLR